MSAEIVRLYDEIITDPAHVLRMVADKIDAGEHGPVGTIGIVVLGNTLEVYGGGEDKADASIAMVLHSGFLRMSRALEEHGQ